MLSVWFDKQSGISSQHEHFGIRHEYNLKHFKSLKIFSKWPLFLAIYQTFERFFSNIVGLISDIDATIEDVLPNETDTNVEKFF